MIPSSLHTSIQLRATMRNLTALSNHEQRLKALATLNGNQYDPQLVALQALLRKLIENTCDLVSIACIMCAPCVRARVERGAR